MSFWILLLYYSKLNCEEMGLALKSGDCCVKICSLQPRGPTEEVFLLSFFWRTKRPRVSGSSACVNSHHNQRKQRPFVTSERTANSNRPTLNGWNWARLICRRAGGLMPPGCFIDPVGGGAVQNQVTLTSCIQFPQIRFQTKHSNLS